MEGNPNSFLCKYLALFSVKYNGTKTYMVIMENAIPENIQSSEIYDLKGSIYGRLADENVDDDDDSVFKVTKTKSINHRKRKSQQCKKDINFREEGRRVFVNSIAEHHFYMNMLRKDIVFLKEQGVT